MNTFLIASALVLITERITAALVAPFKERYPDWPHWWVLIYPTWLLGGLLAWAAGINLVADLVPTLDPIIGRLLTAVIVGGGSNLLHDILAKAPTQTITATASAPGLMTATVRTDPPPQSDTARLGMDG